LEKKKKTKKQKRTTGETVVQNRSKQAPGQKKPETTSTSSPTISQTAEEANAVPSKDDAETGHTTILETATSVFMNEVEQTVNQWSASHPVYNAAAAYLSNQASQYVDIETLKMIYESPFMTALR